MKLLYGTGNPAKLLAMQRRLTPIGLEIIGLKDLKRAAPAIPETGNTSLENAREKALGYYHAFQMPVFSCDSSLILEGVPDEVQPGIHVRTIQGKYLSDEEMLAYYSGLAKTYGDLKGRYWNAICFVLDEEHIYEDFLPSREILITSIPHPRRKKGFPIDSLSQDPATGKYLYDLEDEKLDELAVEDGFLTFFENALGLPESV